MLITAPWAALDAVNVMITNSELHMLMQQYICKLMLLSNVQCCYISMLCLTGADAFCNLVSADVSV